MAVSATWLYGTLDRLGAEQILITEGNATDGTYLVRRSTTDTSVFVLSVCNGARVRHYPVHIQPSLHDDALRFSITGDQGPSPEFGSMEQLLAALREPALGPPAPLIQRLLPHGQRVVVPANNGPVLDASNPFAPPSTTRRNSPDKSAQDAATWSCSVCTFRNRVGVAMCEMCDSLAPNQQLPLDPDAPPPPPRRMTVQSSTSSTHKSSEGTVAASPQRSNPFAGLPVEPVPRAMSDAAALRPLPVDRASGSLTGLVKSGDGAFYNSGGSAADDGIKEILLCEGPLLKIRGLMQNHVRWFALTTRRLMYYTDNGGELISSASLSDVTAVTDIKGGKRFRVTTKAPFGASRNNEMLLEAGSLGIKEKWLRALSMDASETQGFSSDRAELYVEGPLVKVQPLGTSNTTRWFRVTEKKLAYFKEEAGEELGSIPHEFVRQVTLMQNIRDFMVSSAQPFTKTGSYEIHCRAPSEALRSKWITALRRALPADKFKHEARTREAGAPQ
eukprot:m.31975 g.31975  ORF g.31975 m.31975 type:complete len:502 (-) comp9895_c0_seq2:273-1778(-)